jgi:hypothetical protein
MVGFAGAKVAKLRAQGLAAGNGLFGCRDRGPKTGTKYVSLRRDQSRASEWPEISAETPFSAAYRKRAVCEDWMVAPAVPYALNAFQLRDPRKSWMYRSQASVQIVYNGSQEQHPTICSTIFATIGVVHGSLLHNLFTFQLSPSGCTEIIMSVGQSQMSSISTLIEASSSAAVLLGFFIVHISPWYGRIGFDFGFRNPKINEDRARPSNLNTFLMALFNQEIFLGPGG